MIRVRRGEPGRWPWRRRYELEFGVGDDREAYSAVRRGKAADVLSKRVGIGDAWAFILDADRAWERGERGWAVEVDWLKSGGVKYWGNRIWSEVRPAVLLMTKDEVLLLGGPDDVPDVVEPNDVWNGEVLVCLDRDGTLLQVDVVQDAEAGWWRRFSGSDAFVVVSEVTGDSAAALEAIRLRLEAPSGAEFADLAALANSEFYGV